jgi:hypothetical protein
MARFVNVTSGTRGGRQLLKCIHRYFTSAASYDDPADAVSRFKRRSLPDLSPSPSSFSSWRKPRATTRKIQPDATEETAKNHSEEKMDDDEDDRHLFKTAGNQQPFWDANKVRVATAVDALFSNEDVVRKVLSDVESWASDEECLIAFSLVAYQLLEFNSAKKSPFKAITESSL